MNRPAWLVPGAGLALLAVLVLPWVRHGMEATMWRHMLVQAPCWLVAGALVAGAAGARARAMLAAWNRQGIAGLTLASLVLALLMVPRLLDLALYRPGVEVAKLGALLLAGATLRLSWRPAGLVVQGFFLGGTLAMMAMAGMLYQDTPQRLCNAYLLGDQLALGRWLVSVASGVGGVWLIHAARVLMREEAMREVREARAD